MENQVCIFTTTEEHEAIIMRDKLELDGIKATILDKRDTSFETFGEFELYVEPANEQKARAIISAEQ